MRLAIVLCGALAAACAGSMPVPCGGTSCSPGQECCTECGGAQRCMDACGIPMCADASGGGTDAGGAGTDAGGGGTDAGGSGTDAGGSGTDAGGGGTDAGGGGTDAGGTGTDAGGTGTDAGSTDAGPRDAGPLPPCPDGQCRVSTDECELPTGPTGNACCECTDSVCTVRCRCLASDAAIATPSGEVPVSELGVGDLVYTIHEDAVVVAPIVLVQRVPVTDHVVVRVRLANGATFRASPIHPTADGRTFGDLEAGDALDGVAILSAELEPYEGAFTHDILPASDTGAYFIGGVSVGSTLVR